VSLRLGSLAPPWIQRFQSWRSKRDEAGRHAHARPSESSMKENSSNLVIGSVSAGTPANVKRRGELAYIAWSYVKFVEFTNEWTQTSRTPLATVTLRRYQ
jgi:hypothetical protein